MDKIEQTFTRFLKDDEQLNYPDFDAMWSRLEHKLANPEASLAVVDQATPKRNPIRKALVITGLVALLVATPVIAAITYNWDNLLSHRTGVQSALHMGLGQNIEKSVTHDGATLTIHTAIVDDNRTVLLYSLITEHADPLQRPYFAGMNLLDAQGQVIEGRQHQSWDDKSKVWVGYFETEWTPESFEMDVRFTAQTLQIFSSVEKDINLNPFAPEKQIFPIEQDGISELTIEPLDQGDKMLLATEVSFNEPDAERWAYPRIIASKDNVIMKEASSGTFGKPGENGEYTGQQFFQTSDLQQDSVKYMLQYTQVEQRSGQDWTYDLHLNKEQMLSGTEKRELNIPIEHLGKQMVLNQMIVTPTQIRINASHEKHMRFPFTQYSLEVNGTVLNGGIWNVGDSPEETTFRFELPTGVHVNEQTPVTFVVSHEVVEHKDAKEPILLRDISEEKKTMTTWVGGYSVTWTYYKRDGNLFVQSQSADSSFGGVNQTYIRDGEERSIGKQVTANFSGDGINQAIDMYANYTKTEAELHIFWYYTENSSKQLRTEL